MNQPALRLHARLYRARAIDQALQLAAAEEARARLERRREGDYHVVTVAGLDGAEASELLAEVADAALVLTAEQDRR